MKNTETLTLVDDTLTNAEASEILSNMFSSKINFHVIKNWSSQERFGRENEMAQKRIPELRKEVEKLQTILSEAKTNKKRVVVRSEISISLIDE